MSSRLKKWIREKLPADMNNAVPPLPFLPMQRPSVLTPSPSQELVGYMGSDSSEFFQNFPYEIRRQILMEAFGNMTFHMHLTRDPVMLTLSERSEQKKDPKYCSHANLKESPKPISRSHKGAEKKTVIPWQWWSCVCHRLSPRTIHGPWDNGPSKDECYQGTADYCQFWPGKKPTSCSIGIMGFLLASRQAYVEGTDVLYSKNTIIMQGNEMICSLSRLILPQQLQSISSVELICHIGTNGKPTEYLIPEVSFSAFHELIRTLPSTLPGLQRIHISLQSKMRSPNVNPHDMLKIGDTYILPPMEKLLHEMGSGLQECSISIPASFFYIRYKEARGLGDDTDWENFIQPERIWQEISTTGCETGARIRGYWICIGQQDVAIMTTSNMH